METKRDITTTIDITESTLTLEFSNGRKLQIDVNDLNADIVAHAVLHGLKQKLVDAAAISRDPITGKTADINTKYNSVKDVFDRITGEHPEWNKRAGGSGVSGGLLFRALCRLYDRKSPETIKEFLDGQTKKAQAALRANPKIAAIIDEIRAEGGPEIDTDELLNELES